MSARAWRARKLPGKRLSPERAARLDARWARKRKAMIQGWGIRPGDWRFTCTCDEAPVVDLSQPLTVISLRGIVPPGRERGGSNAG